MKKLCILIAGAVCTVMVLESRANLLDDFNDGTIDSGLWGTANTGGASAPSESGGSLNTLTTSSGGFQRSLVYSLATNYNFFANPIEIDAAFTSLGGSGDADSPVDRYVLIGNDDPETTSHYYPSSELNPAGIWASVQNENGTNYVEVGTVRIGSFSSDRRSFTGTLSDLSLELDGQNYTVTASGSGFSMSGGNSFAGSHTLVEADFDGNYRFAMGAANRQSDVSSGSTAEWDSISVTVIPEPASLALFALAGVAIFWFRRCSLQ